MRRRADAKVDSLRLIEGLGRCPERELAAVAGVVDRIDVAAGEVLATERRAGRRAWVIVGGTVEVTSAGNRLWLAGRGTLVGDLGLLGPAPTATSVVAVTDVVALELDPRAVDTFLHLPGVCRWLFSQFERQVRTLVGAADAYDAPPLTVTPLP
jgi:CRP-like cAMP-binding protein